MGKKASDSVFENGLNHVVNNCNEMILCDAEPADRAAAIADARARVTMTSGDFSLANGDVSGRKLVVAAKTGQNVTNSGAYNHVALVSGTELLIVSTATETKNLNNGGTVDVVTWDYELRDPS